MRSIQLTMVVVGSALVAQLATADQVADEVAIRQAVESYVTAFNGGDAEALAAMWSADAIYTRPLSGEQVVGREAISEEFSAIMASDDGAKLSVTTNSVEFISPNVALEYGTAMKVRADQEAEQSNYTAVYIKRDGNWLLDRVTEEEVPYVASHQDRLKELEWLIGDWVDEDDQAKIVSNFQWTKNRNFIIQVFSLTSGDRIENSGMQVIGWDPGAEKMRSWIFDSSGGSGEGHWSHKGDSWYIQSSGMLPDGKKSTSTNIMTFVNEDSFTWQSINRLVGGELLPNVDEVMVVRQADDAPSND